MKKILIGLSFALFGLQSCDVLDVDPQSFYSENVAYASIENVDFYVKDLYQAFHEYSDIEKPVDVYDDSFSDLLKYSWAAIAPGNQVNKFFYYRQGINADRDFRTKWNQAYWHIRELNEFLVDMHNGLASGLDQNKLAIRVAEVRAIRAFVYQELVKRYGGIVLRISEEKVDDHTDRSKARSSEAECWDFIINELDKAAKVLPEQWKDKDGINHVGRITKGAAYGLKARAALYAKRWQDAVDACDEVFKLEKKGVHALLGKNQYNDIFTVPNNKELLLTVNYEKMKLQHSFNLNCCPPYDYKEAGALKDFCGAAMTPTEEYASQFDIKVNGNWQSFTWDNLSQYANGPWTDRDPRFYASIGFDRGIWFGQGKTDINNYNDLLVVKSRYREKCGFIGNRFYSITGYFSKKLVDYQAIVSDDVAMTQDAVPFPSIRLADLYLLYAEALNETKQSPDDEVFEYIDKVRERAGLDGVEKAWTEHSKRPDKFRSKEGMREIIHRERLIELAMEGHAMWDLRRWKEAEEWYNRPVRGWNINKEEAEEFYKQVYLLQRVYSKKNYLWPIKDDEIRNNPKLIQNYGW